MPIVPDDVSFNKAAIIERAIRRAREEFSLDPDLVKRTSESLRSLNQNYVVLTPVDKAEIISGFIGKIATNSRDLEPEVVAVVNRHFGDLF